MEKTEIYVDESIHEGAGFIMTAAVVCNQNLDSEISQCLRAVGLVPGQDEYKSSSLKAGNHSAARLRTELMWLIRKSHLRVALAVTPTQARAQAGRDMLGLIQNNIIDGYKGSEIKIWFDQGLMVNLDRRENPTQGFELHTKSDSRHVLGLQLADLVAHSASMIMKCELGIINKSNPVGKGSGYDPDMEMTLDFELWAGLRHNLAGSYTPPPDTDDPVELATLNPFGLYINPSCAPDVIHAAEKRFGSVYLGCIH